MERLAHENECVAEAGLLCFRGRVFTSADGESSDPPEPEPETRGPAGLNRKEREEYADRHHERGAGGEWSLALGSEDDEARSKDDERNERRVEKSRPGELSSVPV